MNTWTVCKGNECSCLGDGGNDEYTRGVCVVHVFNYIWHSFLCIYMAGDTMILATLITRCGCSKVVAVSGDWRDQPPWEIEVALLGKIDPVWRVLSPQNSKEVVPITLIDHRMETRRFRLNRVKARCVYPNQFKVGPIEAEYREEA